MAGKENMYYLKLIHNRLKSGGVMTVEQLSANSGATPKLMKDRLSRYAKQGRIYRVARNQYSLDPNAVPEINQQKGLTRAQKRKEISEKVGTVYSCFYNMVRCK
jgi:predicted transcriptional regulator of viral defense system